MISKKLDHLKDKNILITGASKGIGRSLAVNLSKHKANVILLARNEDLLDSLYDEIKEKYNTNPMIIGCDLSQFEEDKAQEIANVVSKNYKCLDALINNASILKKMSSVNDYDLKSWKKVLNVNLTSAFLLSKYLMPLMMDSKLPRIIFTSSGVANKGKAYWGAYSVSKAGIKNLSEILNDELNSLTNFKVFNFNPKETRTEMRALAYPAENPSSVKAPDELINYYLWMLSERSTSSSKTHINFGDEI
jgi:short-subunit dehydrogenase|tara:strand:+ start:506 stop:1249 length:744 start_codon:yes stop_codon:yes gene_type:complete